MILFGGTYKLERKADHMDNPAHACTWWVKIIDFSSGAPIYPRIRPNALLAFRMAGGIFLISCAESTGKRICRDFNLNVSDLLWVEAFTQPPGARYVAVFTPCVKNTETHSTVA